MELATYSFDEAPPFDAFALHGVFTTDRPSADSATVNNHSEADAAVDYPATSFPLYTHARLQDFLARLAMASANVSSPSLAMVSEPNLYTLIAAVFWFGRDSDADLDAVLGSAGFIPECPDTGTGHAWATLLPDLRAELRWRNCQSMGKIQLARCVVAACCNSWAVSPLWRDIAHRRCISTDSPLTARCATRRRPSAYFSPTSNGVVSPATDAAACQNSPVNSWTI